MAADVFTKSFSNPLLWEAVCWLVNLCEADKISDFVKSGDAPPPTSQGGGKRGIWVIKADGSGTWTRLDPKAVRCRTLYRSGPARHEVHLRETFDDATGRLIESTKNFATAKVIDQEIPSPRPRALRTVFHFAQTQQVIPHDAERESTEGPASKPAQAKAAASQGSAGSDKIARLRSQWEESSDELRFVGNELGVWRDKLVLAGLSTELPTLCHSREVVPDNVRVDINELWDKLEVYKRRYADHVGRRVWLSEGL